MYANHDTNDQRRLARNLAKEFHVDVIHRQYRLITESPNYPVPPLKKLRSGVYLLWCKSQNAGNPETSNDLYANTPDGYSWKRPGGNEWVGDPPASRRSLHPQGSGEKPLANCYIYKTSANQGNEGWFVLHVRSSYSGDEMELDFEDLAANIEYTETFCAGTGNVDEGAFQSHESQGNAKFDNVLIMGKLIVLSDERSKKNIEVLQGDLCDIADRLFQLDPIQFERGGTLNIGYSAQQVKELLPKAITEVHIDMRSSNADEPMYLAVDQTAMIAYVHIGLKHLTKTVRGLEAIMKPLRLLLGSSFNRADSLNYPPQLDDFLGCALDNDADASPYSPDESTTEPTGHQPKLARFGTMTPEAATAKICHELKEDASKDHVLKTVRTISVERALEILDEVLTMDDLKGKTPGGWWFKFAKQAKSKASQLPANPESIRDRVWPHQRQAVDVIGDKNAILVIPTGGGKTLIACLVCERSLNRSPEKSFALFICQDAALARQQADKFRRDGPPDWRTPGALVLAVGGEPVQHVDPDKNEWRSAPSMVLDKTSWTSVTTQSKVVFCTAGLLTNIISDETWTADRLCLAIFDEAHHAKEGNHAFVKVASRLSSEKHVQLLGLTASPATGSTNVLELKSHIEVLKQNLKDAELVHIKPSDSPQKRLEPERVRVSPNACERPVSSIFRELLSAVFEYCVEAGGMTAACPCRFDDSRETFGPMFFRWANKEIINARKKDNRALESGVDALKHLVQLYQLVQDIGAIAARDINQVLFRIRRKFGDVDDAALMTLILPWFQKLGVHLDPETFRSAKMDKLIELIQRSHPKESKQTLLRVATQRGAFWLVEYLRSRGVECAPLLGRGKMTVTRVQSTLDDFKAGKTQVLVGTSLVEEGIDLTECDLVIAFTVRKLLHSGKSLIQNNGRARKTEARFIVLCESSAEEMALENLMNQVDAMNLAVANGKSEDL